MHGKRGNKHLLSNYAIPLRTVCKILTFLPKVTRLIFNLIGSKPTAGLTIPYYRTYGPRVLLAVTVFKIVLRRYFKIKSLKVY